MCVQVQPPHLLCQHPGKCLCSFGGFGHCKKTFTVHLSGTIGCVFIHHTFCANTQVCFCALWRFQSLKAVQVRWKTFIMTMQIPHGFDVWNTVNKTVFFSRNFSVRLLWLLTFSYNNNRELIEHVRKFKVLYNLKTDESYIFFNPNWCAQVCRKYTYMKPLYIHTDVLCSCLQFACSLMIK